MEAMTDCMAMMPKSMDMDNKSGSMMKKDKGVVDDQKK